MKEFSIEKSKNTVIYVKIDDVANISSFCTDHAIPVNLEKIEETNLDNFLNPDFEFDSNTTYIVSLPGEKLVKFTERIENKKIFWIYTPLGIKDLVLNGEFPYFSYPNGIFIDNNRLNAINEENFYLLIAYSMGFSLANDTNLYTFLINNLYELCDQEPGIVEELIEKIYQIHGRIMIRKTKEERKIVPILSYLGGFFQTFPEFKEADAVAYGAIMGAYFSYKEEMLTTEEYYEVRDMFVPFGLSITQTKYTKPELFKAFKEYTKKHPESNVAPIKKIGRLGYLCKDVAKKINEEHFEAIYFDENAND